MTVADLKYFTQDPLWFFNPSCSFLNILYLSGPLTQDAENRDRLMSKLSQTVSIMELHLNSLTGRMLYDEKRLSNPLPGSISDGQNWPWVTWSGPVADPAVSRRMDVRTPEVPSSLNYLMVRYWELLFALGFNMASLSKMIFLECPRHFPNLQTLHKQCGWRSANISAALPMALVFSLHEKHLRYPTLKPHACLEGEEEIISSSNS